MARLDGLRRATFFDDSGYSPSTKESYEYRSKPLLSAARKAGFSPLESSKGWILQFFFDQAMSSLREARKQLPAVAHYFRINGRGEDFPYEAVVDLLREASGNARDPLGAALATVSVPRTQRRRARAVAGKAMKKTRESYARFASAWEVYCRRYHLDPLRASLRQFLGFLAFYLRTRRYHTLSNLCNALSHYFRNAKTASGEAVTDLTREEKVRVFLAIAAKNDAETSEFRPLFAEDVRAIVQPMGDAPLDIRDRNMVLLNHYGTFFGLEMSRIENDVEVSDEGVKVKLDGQEILVYGIDDEQLDIRVWMTKWLSILGPGRRPLFPGWARRRWTQVSLDGASICAIIKKAARRVGIEVPHVTLALRKGFAIRGNRVVGAERTAKYMRLSRTSSLAQHVGGINRPEFPCATRRRALGEPASQPMLWD